MDHDKMNHGAHGHDNHDASTPARCAMHMLLTTDTTDLCILVPQWRITTTFSLVRALLLVVGMGMAFEAVRGVTRRYEADNGMHHHGGNGVRLPTSRPTSPSSSSSSFSTTTGTGTTTIGSRRRRRVIKSVLYATQVGISFLLMLVFMTYNVQVMAAVVVGSGLGYWFFHVDVVDPYGANGKGMACH